MTIETLKKGADGDISTLILPYEDYGLLLVNYDAPPPPVRLFRVNIEGRNGSLDMTEWAGDTFYDDRTVSVKLRDLSGKPYAFINAITSRRVRLCFDADDPDWYYQGRVDDIQVSTRNHVSEITLKFSCHPFKYPAIGEDDYKPGSTGLAYSGRREFTVTAADDESETVTRTLHQAEVSPMTVVISGLADSVTTCKLTVNGTDYAITDNGTMDEIMLRPGNNTITLVNNSNGQSLTAAATFGDRVV